MEIRVGRVVSNEDPERLGHLKVAFIGDDENAIEKTVSYTSPS